MSEARGLWGSKLGFVLAASGSAIGLGNIVFFGANAYKFGGGAFYVPYLIALLFLGLPMMLVELGIGHSTRSAFPGAMKATSGRAAEGFAWWSLINAIVIAMYYILILSWAAVLMFKSFGDGYFDATGETWQGLNVSWSPVGVAILLWAINVFFLFRGTRSIERVVKIFVPLMWIFMIALVIRGLTLDGGIEGVWYLFTPNFDGISKAAVWQGAFSQMFFSLSLGLGTMVVYASYLPKKTDLVSSGSMVAFLNCSFEFIAGVAIFSMLFAFSIVPNAGTLGMSFVVIPTGIGHFPAAQAVFAFFFFLLLLMAGLTSSISIVEGPTSALRDKFGWSRKKALAIVAGAGTVGSIIFALPLVEKLGSETAPIGFSLFDIVDHWAFGYSLLIVGLTEAIFLGHVYGIEKLRKKLNANSRFKLGAWFDVLIKWVIPALISVVLAFNILSELGISSEALGLEAKGFYKKKFGAISWITFFVWLVGTSAGAVLLARAPWRDGAPDLDNPPPTARVVEEAE